MRLPLRALPVAIRVATKVRKAAWALYDAACALESDLESMAEPQTVEDLCPTPFGMSDAELDAEEALIRRWAEQRTCFECGTSDPTGFCPAHRVLDKGRVN